MTSKIFGPENKLLAEFDENQPVPDEVSGLIRLMDHSQTRIYTTRLKEEIPAVVVSTRFCCRVNGVSVRTRSLNGEIITELTKGSRIDIADFSIIVEP